MQENEFEKSIRQEMDEFRLRPPDAVWTNLEQQLKRKKRRRFAFIVLLLAGLSLLSYPGYILLKPGKPDLAEHTPALPEKDQPEKQLEEGIVEPNEKETEISSRPMDQKSNDQSKSVKQEEIVTVRKDQAGKTPRNSLNTPLKGIRKNITKTKSQLPPDAGEGNEKSSVEKKNDLQANEKDQLVKPEITTSGKKELKDVHGEKEYALNDRQIQADPDSATKVEESMAIEKENLKKDSVEKETTTVAKAKKNTPGIKWGFDLSAGVSNAMSDLFSLNAGLQDAGQFSSVTPGSGGGGSTAIPFFAPAEPGASFGFRAGISLESEVSRRSVLGAGLAYGYLSHTIRTGAYKDTNVVVTRSSAQPLSVSSIFGGFPQKTFRNQFHFIQVPVYYRFQFNQGKSLPLSWTIGLAPGYLISTNALVYDTTANGIYFRDRDAFRKFQLNITSGFAVHAGKNNRVEWIIGPEVSLSTRRLLKNSYFQKQYLFYGGITGKILFTKKKWK